MFDKGFLGGVSGSVPVALCIALHVLKTVYASTCIPVHCQMKAQNISACHEHTIHCQPSTITHDRDSQYGDV